MSGKMAIFSFLCRTAHSAAETPLGFKCKSSHFLFGTGFSSAYEKMFMLKIYLKLEKTIVRNEQEYNI